MEENTSIPNTKVQNIGESKDRLSRLPEDVIEHVLSFLPTKHAVGTSILSRGWRYHWTSVSVLDFDDNLCANQENDAREKFMNFVDRVLLFHGSKMDKFYLTCTAFHDASRVNAWISTAIRRKVNEIVIDIVLQDPLTLPRSIFTCESLTILKIGRDYILNTGVSWPYDDIKLPTLITLASLKVMHLREMMFTCDQSIQQVTFNLPVLQEFVMEECSWLNINTIEVFAPLLEKLDVNDPYYVLCGFEMTICAERVISLVLKNSPSCLYSLNNLPSIINANIVLRGQDKRHRAIALFRKIATVKDLTVSLGVIESARLAGNLPDFPNVTNLSLSVLSGVSREQVISVLRHMPCIESLVLTGMVYGLSMEEYDMTPSTLPKCFISSLKSFKLSCFEGSANELSIVHFFLKHARVLKKVTLSTHPDLPLDSQKQFEICKQLLMLPRASECAIDLS
ncbi:hypothetical protein ACHQM5_004564 [Ranunculus cassubicifolius]